MREDHRKPPRERLPAYHAPASGDRRSVESRQPRRQRADFQDAIPRTSHLQGKVASAWPPSRPQPPETPNNPGRPGRAVQRGRPSVVSYLDEDHQGYTLLDLIDREETSVPKRRAMPEVFPPTRQNPAPGAGLLRLSGYALLGALLGGAPGVALGLVIAVIALARLDRFERRAHSWRRKAMQAAQDAQQRRLPVGATSERLRLMTALWQSLGAVALGGVALLLLFTALH